MHAQLREIYRKNGDLPVSEEEFRACQERKKCEILLSQGMTWTLPEPIPYDTNGYEHGKKAAIMLREGEIPFNTFQEGVDIAIERAKKGIPSSINFGGNIANVPPLLQGEVMKEIEPPDGVHILSVPRIGDEVRNTYLEKLREAYGGGYLSQDEIDARQGAALKAESREDLEKLVKDLSLIPEKKEKLPEKKKERTWTSPRVIVPALAALLGCYNSVTAGIHDSLPILIPSLIITGLFVFLMCIGVTKGKSSGSS